MLSRSEIRERAMSNAYSRGLGIAREEGSVFDRGKFKSDKTTLLKAQVKSASGNGSYKATLELNRSETMISSYTCTCAAYEDYGIYGMCKHCVALALAYREDASSFAELEEAEDKPTPASGNAVDAGTQTSAEQEQVVSPQRTSPLLADYLDNATKALVSARTQPVSLGLVLRAGSSRWEAEFTLQGAKRAYVLSDIDAFVLRMENAEVYSYGKQLVLTHVPEAFDARSQRVIKLLQRITAKARTQDSSWRSSRSGARRSVSLSAAEAIELLDLYRDTSFQLLGIYAQRGATGITCHVVEGNPQVSVSLVRKEQERGYQLACKGLEDMFFISSEDRLYLWASGGVFYRCTPEFSQCSNFLEIIADPSRPQFVSDDDMPRLCTSVLSKIAQPLGIEVPEKWRDVQVQPCLLQFYFDRVLGSLVCNAKAVYGERTYSASVMPEDFIANPLRDIDVERKAVELADSYFDEHRPDGTFALDANDERAVARLIFEGLSEFRELGDVFTTRTFDGLRSPDTPSVQFSVRLKGGLVNLSMETGGFPPEEMRAILESYHEKKSYHRLKDGTLVDLRNAQLDIASSVAADLDLSNRDFARGLVTLPGYRAFYLDSLIDDADKDDSFMEYLDEFRNVDPERYTVPPALAKVLRSYQEQGFRWLSTVADMGFGGVLADEMGLGKTLQMIAFLLSRRDEARKIGPSIIVCPASLVYNWEAEFARFAPELTVRVIAGSQLDRARIRARGACDVFITSYDLLRIDVDDYERMTFYTEVLDEAQYVKNHHTKAARAVKRVPARHRFALTGTPIENRLSELWSIFDFLMPGLLGGYKRFRTRYEKPIADGDEDVMHRLQLVVSPFILRRTKADVLTDLPEKLDMVVYAHFGEEQRELYDAREQRLRMALQKDEGQDGKALGKIEILAELTRLRQICCDPRLIYNDYRGEAAKLETILELVESATEGGAKALVFSQFTSFLSVIAGRLARQKMPYYEMTGSTPKKKRVELVNAFNSDDTPVFLISLKAGGTGLNLTGASVVIHADPWWNAAAQNQATDRAHRIGQTRNVNVYKVIAKGTIEERILDLQRAKSDLADQIMNTGGLSLASLQREDLLALLSD